MLKNFFEIDEVKQSFSNASQLISHLSTHDLLEYTEVYPDRLNGKSTPTPNKQFKNKTFKNVRFSNFKFFNINFHNCKFIDCVFINAQFTGCAFVTSSENRVINDADVASCSTVE
ncbi:MAG: pentapeptide repeat-containing protein [Methylocystaceae bacterium]|nr:pentapeptide repeat-containing protein [Methylocystaceae bacterium]